MRYFTVLVFCVIGFSGQAQSAWQWGLTLSGGLSGEAGETLIDENFAPSGFGASRIIHRSERRMQPTYGAGIWLGRTFGTHFEATVGVSFFHKRQYYKTDEFLEFSSSAVTMSQSITKTHLHQRSIKIPLKVNYLLGKPGDWCRPFISAGLSADYAIQLRTSSTIFSTDGFGGENMRTVTDKVTLNTPQRWSFPIEPGVGVQLGTMRLSVQHSMLLHDPKLYEAPEYYAYHGFGFICCLGDCDIPYFEFSKKSRSSTTINLSYMF